MKRKENKPANKLLLDISDFILLLLLVNKLVLEKI
jgi:hypothetical protein